MDCVFLSHTTNTTHYTMALSTHYAITINNPDENDHAMCVRGHPDYFKHFVWQEEVGADGTPHIQGLVKLHRNQRFSFMKKLFPRAHITTLTSDEHRENMLHYVQKNSDDGSNTHHQLGGETPADALQLLQKFMGIYASQKGVKALEETYGIDITKLNTEQIFPSRTDINQARIGIEVYERQAVIDNPFVSKALVGPLYGNLKKKYFVEIYTNTLQDIHKQYVNGEYEEEAQEVVIPQADPDSDGSEPDEGTESGGSCSDEDSGADEDSSSATDSSSDVL